MAWEVNRNFAEGDSGVPILGDATRHWAKLYEAKLDAEAEPMKVAPISVAIFQASIVTIAMDKANKVADRLKAFELAMRISEQYAEELAVEEKRLSPDVGQR